MSSVEEMAAVLRSLLAQFPIDDLSVHRDQGKEVLQRLLQIATGSTHQRLTAALAAIAAGNADLDEAILLLRSAQVKLESYLAVITGRVSPTVIISGPATGALHLSVAGRTRPTLPYDPNRRPGGTPAEAHPTKSKDRGKRRENESAALLARYGYDITQSPPGKSNNKNPDYLISGNYWDCYAPDSRDLDRIRKSIRDKLRSGQADRIILNLSDTPVTPSQFLGHLKRKPIPGLQEIKIIKDDHIIDPY